MINLPEKGGGNLMSSVNSDNIENSAFNGGYTYVTIQI